MIYVFSDGFADQFGGVNGKKYRYRKFREFLISIVNESVSDLLKHLKSEFQNWKGPHEQIHDILVISSRIE